MQECFGTALLDGKHGPCGWKRKATHHVRKTWTKPRGEPNKYGGYYLEQIWAGTPQSDEFDVCKAHARTWQSLQARTSTSIDPNWSVTVTPLAFQT